MVERCVFAVDAAASPAAPAVNSTGLAEVVVTAERRQTNLQRAAIAVSAITGADLEKAGVNSTEDLTRTEPSIVIALAPGNTPQVYVRGVGSKYIRVALARFEKLIADMDDALGRTEWLAGDAYSLADADFTPYLDRLTDLGLDFLWADCAAVKRWIAVVRARPSFAEVTERWVPAEAKAHNAVLRLKAGPKFRALMTDASPLPG